MGRFKLSTNTSRGRPTNLDGASMRDSDGVRRRSRRLAFFFAAAGLIYSIGRTALLSIMNTGQPIMNIEQR
jgi:hypothetical protein